MKNLDKNILNLIQKTSTSLPQDVLKSIKSASKKEDSENSLMHETYKIILENIELAENENLPICQDTGILNFFVYAPTWLDKKDFVHEVNKAVKKATADGFLRHNLIDSFTNKDIEENYGIGTPNFHFEQWDKTYVDVYLLMKGGGSENASMQFSLPDSSIKAERNLEGIKKCAVNAVLKTQGRGCAPGILGIAVGGDRATGFIESKKQLLRELDDRNEVRGLAKFEDEILEASNSLDVGAMGLGGNVSLLASKIKFLPRHPACYYVTISYSCWALRRQGLRIDRKGDVVKWIY